MHLDAGLHRDIHKTRIRLFSIKYSSLWEKNIKIKNVTLSSKLKKPDQEENPWPVAGLSAIY